MPYNSLHLRDPSYQKVVDIPFENLYNIYIESEESNMKRIKFIRKVYRTELVDEICFLQDDAYTTLPEWIDNADEETMDSEEFQEELHDFVHENNWEAEVQYDEYLEYLDTQIEGIYDIEIGDA